MTKVILSKISIKSQKRIKTFGGDILKILKKREKSYQGFGAAYFSWVGYKKIKAWKFHKVMTMNLTVPFGNIKFVFYDHLSKKFRVEIIGEKNYSRITVPPKIWFGFQGISRSNNLLFNFSNIEHESKEVLRCALKDINYKW